MVFNYFKKDTDIAFGKALEKLLRAVPHVHHNLKSRARKASAGKPFKQLTEGQVSGRKFVFSLQKSPALNASNHYIIEFILHCDNPAWVHLQLADTSKTHIFKSSLGLVRIPNTILVKKNIHLACNQPQFVEMSINKNILDKLSRIEFSAIDCFQIERKRLYIRSASVDRSTINQTFLNQWFDSSLDILQQIDAYSST